MKKWQYKEFKTKEKFEAFTNNPKIQWVRVYVNDSDYAIEYRLKRVIQFD